MAEETGRRSFRLQRSQSNLSFRIDGRSKSSRLLQENLSSTADHRHQVLPPLPGYERLSQSMRFFSNVPTTRSAEEQRSRKQGALWVGRITARLFSRKEEGGAACSAAAEGKAKERRKTRSSWLPDPDKRWPVQGW